MMQNINKFEQLKKLLSVKMFTAPHVREKINLCCHEAALIYSDYTDVVCDILLTFALCVQQHVLLKRCVPGVCNRLSQ